MSRSVHGMVHQNICRSYDPILIRTKTRALNCSCHVLGTVLQCMSNSINHTSHETHHALDTRKFSMSIRGADTTLESADSALSAYFLHMQCAERRMHSEEGLRAFLPKKFYKNGLRPRPLWTCARIPKLATCTRNMPGVRDCK